jgi:hypothetical protein
MTDVRDTNSDAERAAEDELNLLIGRTARGHVDLDLIVREVFHWLAHPGLGTWLVNTSDSTTATIEACLTMLSHATAPDDVKTAGADALRAAKTATKHRNDVVHDLWVERSVEGLGDGSASGSWIQYSRVRHGQAGHVRTEPRDVDFARRTLAEVDHAHWRLFALADLLMPGMAIGGVPLPGMEAEREKTFAVLAEVFDG